VSTPSPLWSVVVRHQADALPVHTSPEMQYGDISVTARFEHCPNEREHQQLDRGQTEMRDEGVACARWYELNQCFELSESEAQVIDSLPAEECGRSLHPLSAN